MGSVTSTTSNPPAASIAPTSSYTATPVKSVDASAPAMFPPDTLWSCARFASQIATTFAPEIRFQFP